jgi:hypothetical protein
MMEEKQKTKSILCLHYFLFLEPNSKRSISAYNAIMNQFEGNVKKDLKDTNKFDINFDISGTDTLFNSADLLISMLDASKILDDNKNKSEDELFIQNTKLLFEFLGENNKKEYFGIWWEYYVPFFYSICLDKYIETYCNYISQSGDGRAVEWMKNNKLKIDEFDKWLREK